MKIAQLNHHSFPLLQLFDRLPEGHGTALKMNVGNFAVFFPGEGHEPCVGDPDTTVIKAVVKLRIN